MLHQRTIDLKERAADIADREAKNVGRATGDDTLWFQTWMHTYQSALAEFLSEYLWAA